MRGLSGLVLVLMSVATFAESSEYQNGYRQGYDDGFQAGLRAGGSGSNGTASRPSAPARIRIYTAMYGSDDKQCDASRYVIPKANGRSSASIAVTNQMCGDPHPGERKSLRVVYSCGDGDKEASAYEHRDVYLSCS